MRKRLSAAITAIVAVVLLFNGAAAAQTDEIKKINDATEVMEAIRAIPEKGIPESLLKKARAIAVIPGVIKLGFVIGGRFGRGVIVVREDDAWSNPSFITIAGGSFGYQIGAQSTDIVLVFMSEKSVDGIINGKFTLGADASVAAGPVGRHAEASTDVTLDAEIYSYSRNRGLFIGISFEGGVLQIDGKSNERFYGAKGTSPEEIFEGKVRNVPAPAQKFLQTLAE